MPALESEQSHYGIDEQDPSPSSAYHVAARGAIDSGNLPSLSSAAIPPLPSYVPSTRRRPSGSSQADPTSSRLQTNPPTSSPQDEDLTDPHDFYRHHHDPFGMGLKVGLGQGDIRVEKRGDARGTFNHTSRPNHVSAPMDGPEILPLTSRINARYASSPTSGSSPLSATKSSPALSSTAQKRQTSVRELANRFNETASEVPPLPMGSTSRSASTSSNAGKSRASSRSKNVLESHPRNGWTEGDMEIFKTPRSPRSPTARSRRRRVQEELVSPKSGAYPMSQPMNLVNSIPLASQSMTDLGPQIDALPRKPLFGEVVATNPKAADAGVGARAVRPRRTSEGSMHSPNPMFTKSASSSGADSPTAYYQAVGPTSKVVNTRTIIQERPSIHQRTMSDHQIGTEPSYPPTSNMYGVDGTRSSSPTSTNTSKRSSQSRIPLPTSRRPSVNSDSGNSNVSTRNSSAVGHLKSPTRSSQVRTRAPPPKPLQTTRSPPQNSRSNTPQRSPRHIDHMTSARQPAKSPRLNAYISAPMPKKSPPLRSSRPRMPVSSASTSASRAKAVERFSGGSPTNRKEPRTKKPKELEGMEIDIAARRQAIQRSYTKKVGERERQHEEKERRRASMMLGSLASDQSMTLVEANTAQLPEAALQNTNHKRRDEKVTSEAASEDTVVESRRSDRELTIDTGQRMDRSVLDLSIEDSPTLGTFDRFPRRGGQGTGTSLTEELEPSSAVTTGTSDSVDTFFDDEPQEESPDSSHRGSQAQADFTQIMNMQGSESPSPTSMHGQSALDAASERDDRESIQIMLGETPVLEHAPFKDEHFGSKLKESTSSEDPDSRWSMTSFTSSNRSRDERDMPMERIDEHYPTRESPSLVSEQPAHLSISTNSTSERPQQPWSPASLASPNTTRTTIDSDTYSTINRVLDHYHDPNLTSPEALQDVQQHLFDTQSPMLARQGGWDPKKVTQLYLQQLTKERTAQTKTQPQQQIEPPAVKADGLKLQINNQSSSLMVAPPVAEKEVRDDLDEKIIQPAEHRRQESAASFRSSFHLSEIDDGVDRPARASLNRPEDWSMSPSLGGYDYQALDSPVISDEKPLPPAKAWMSLQKQLQELPDPKTSLEPAGGFVSRPQLPPIQGIGLEINVEPPQSADTPTMTDMPPPPLPRKAPPPPPSHPTQPSTLDPGEVRHPSPPSDYSKDTPPAVYTDRKNDSDPPMPPPPNGVNRPPPSLPPSLRPSVSSGVNSLSRETSLDGPPASTESIDKSASLADEQKRLTKRTHIIKELVDTEHSYCQDMKVVEDIYKGTSNVIISVEDVKTLFGNSDQIVAFSTNFLDALKHASKSVYVLAKARRWKSNRISTNTTYSGTTTDDQSSISGPELSDDERDRKTFIGESFGHHMQGMEKVYSEYLKNHDAANSKLQALQKNEKVMIWLKECQAYARDLTSAWNLDSLLVKPVQRILKYPLLLDQLLAATPDNHPDFTALDAACREMKGISMRINEMKKRADVMEQMNSKERKRKESDVRIGFPKAFGRRTEKLKQQVGLTDSMEDKGYAAVKHKFGEHFFQLQVVMRDTEMYCNDIQVFMNQFCEFAMAMEAHIDVAQTSYPEVESKWRKFRMLTRDMSTTALPDHISAVRKHVIAPMITVLALHQKPEELMRKRDKKLLDYAKYKSIKERGDKPDKKTAQQGEQFIAINDTLKDELPRLFDKTGKLLHACLNNFIHLQISWQGLWRKKLRNALDDAPIPSGSQEIVDAFQSDFSFFEAQVNSLSACNGAMMNETVNLLSTTTTLNGDADLVSPKQAPPMGRRRTMSIGNDKSPMLPQPDFGDRSNGSFFVVGDASLQATGLGMQRQVSRRMRASSSLSGHSPKTPEVPGSYRSYSNTTTPVNPTPGRPNTSAGRTYTEPSPIRPGFEAAKMHRLSDDSAFKSQRTSGTTYPPTSQPRQSTDDLSSRYSDIFSSAMPMSDSPPNESTMGGPMQTSGFNVIFLAASVYEFNIDRARKEAGYPYLTYVAGEIFDVIGEKGELWLAKNQDDANNEVGWIWNKHFVKLAH